MNSNKILLLSLLLMLTALIAEAKDSGQDQPKKIGVLPASIFHIQTSMRETIDLLIEAYQNKRADRFMSLVAEDFYADKTILDRAIRKDFSAFHNIGIRYSLNNITIDSKDTMVYVSLNFTRFYTEIKTGKTFTDTSATEMVFKIVNGELKLYIMKRPYLFGISD